MRGQFVSDILKLRASSEFYARAKKKVTEGSERQSGGLRVRLYDAINFSLQLSQQLVVVMCYIVYYTRLTSRCRNRKKIVKT